MTPNHPTPCETAPDGPRSYRDVLASKGMQPLVIERTEKRAGDLVLRSSALPVLAVLS